MASPQSRGYDWHCTNRFEPLTAHLRPMKELISTPWTEFSMRQVKLQDCHKQQPLPFFFINTLVICTWDNFCTPPSHAWTITADGLLPQTCSHKRKMNQTVKNEQLEGMPRGAATRMLQPEYCLLISWYNFWQLCKQKLLFYKILENPALVSTNWNIGKELLHHCKKWQPIKKK